jgi:hypothetical protein
MNKSPNETKKLVEWFSHVLIDLSMRQRVVVEVFFQFNKQRKQMKALFWNNKVFSLGLNLNDFEKKGVCFFSIKRKERLEIFHCKKSWLFQQKNLIIKVTFCTFTNLID